MKKLTTLLLLVLALGAFADFQIDFPLASDTWEVVSDPYWWNIGDTVYGDRDLGTDDITQLDIYLPLDYNSLTASGFVDLDIRVDGNTIASFTIINTDGMLVERTIDLSSSPVTPTGTMEFRYYETNQVAGGQGSIIPADTGGTVDFTTGGSNIVESSFGQIKAEFK